MEANVYALNGVRKPPAMDGLKPMYDLRMIVAG